VLDLSAQSRKLVGAGRKCRHHCVSVLLLAILTGVVRHEAAVDTRRAGRALDAQAAYDEVIRRFPV